jgi:rhodanese-related sulfurtransferase/DNA-binding transcriptional ArsR family regulator
MNELKRQLNEHFSRIGKALASPHRLELIELLAQGEQTVDALSKSLGVPLANASHHLRALKSARLVESRNEGTFVFYRLADGDVFELARRIRVLAGRHIAEVDRIVSKYFNARDELDPVDARQLLDRVRSGDIVVLDARPAAEYRAGHIPGAFSIPVNELEKRLSELPQDKEVIAYCRGPYCVMALEAVRRLRLRGRKARRLAEGFPEWRAAGLPVETDPPGAAASS